MARPSSQDPRNEVVTDRGSGRREAPAGPPTPAAVPTKDEADARVSEPTEAVPVTPADTDPLWGVALVGPTPAVVPAPSAPRPPATREQPSEPVKPPSEPPAGDSAPPPAEPPPEPPVDKVVRRPVVVGRHRRPRVRRVTRVVRAVDTWSVFKISLLFFFLIYLSTLLAAVLLWNVANVTGTVDNVERFFESFGWETFEFNGGELYRAGWVIGLFLVVGLTGLTVLAATTFNLIADLVGGVRVTVLEEEVVVRGSAGVARQRKVRSPPAGPASGPPTGPPTEPPTAKPTDARPVDGSG